MIDQEARRPRPSSCRSSAVQTPRRPRTPSAFHAGDQLGIDFAQGSQRGGRVGRLHDHIGHHRVQLGAFISGVEYIEGVTECLETLV